MPKMNQSESENMAFLLGQAANRIDLAIQIAEHARDDLIENDVNHMEHLYSVRDGLSKFSSWIEDERNS